MSLREATRSRGVGLLLAALWMAGAACGAPPPSPSPHHLWLEAESFAPLHGGNYPFFAEERQTKGTWSIAGPGAASTWTQGGESEFMSIAARADEPREIVVSRQVEVPEAGDYALWVRYADYRGKAEAFGVRVLQGAAVTDRRFGAHAVVDELDPMKLLWDWSFGWDRATVPLAKGAARVEIYLPGPSEARRQVDCLCLTTDREYLPRGREKPDFSFLAPLRRVATWPLSDGVRLARPLAGDRPAQAWAAPADPPAFLWNVQASWLEELKKPMAAARPGSEFLFRLDRPLVEIFQETFRQAPPPVYSHPRSGPVWHIPSYPVAFAEGSPFLQWLDRHPQRPFALLLNYGAPAWPEGADRRRVRANLQRYADRFVGFIAGENIAYAEPDAAVLEGRVRAARSRSDVLAALRELHTAGARAKFGDYYGVPVTDQEAWGPVISCLSATFEAFAHALCHWGTRRLGHENTGNSPTLARRLAFLRGAARQFGAGMVNYQSCNLGDAATIFAQEDYFYPASPRYILDNQYDVWAGAGTAWLLRDYLLWHLAGAEAFYHEQGGDIFWKPGGNSAGDTFPLQLSPKGKVADWVQRFATAHPRGVQYTPVAFLVDEAHGWSQERFQPGAFGLDPQWNPAVLTPGRHEANLRGWFDIAYYPAPETQNEPATAIRQTYVNGIFGDIFDVIAAVPGKTAIAATYPVLIIAGEVELSREWGRALRDAVRRGATLVVCAEQLSGPGVRDLDVPAGVAEREAGWFKWTPTGEEVPANRFRYLALAGGKNRVLATAPDGAAIAVTRAQGEGRVIFVGVPLGLGIDARPVPLLSLLMRHLTDGLTPVQVGGDVEWILNRLEDGWVVALFNNRGILKPQHGVLPTDHREAQTVTLRVPFSVAQSREWLTQTDIAWEASGPGAMARLTVPAGAVRFVEIRSRR